MSVFDLQRVHQGDAGHSERCDDGEYAGGGGFCFRTERQTGNCPSGTYVISDTVSLTAGHGLRKKISRGDA